MQRDLTDAERLFAETVASAFESFAAIRTHAQAVTEDGGSCREAFLSVFDDDTRAQAEGQWTMIALMLGVPLS